MRAKNPLISVVIPTYNEATYVGRLLEDLCEQTFKDFEVIVSDAQSKDGIDKVINQYSKKLNIKLVESPPKGPGAGRNFGAKYTKGQWLLFLDADDEIDDTNFITTLLSETKARGWQTSSAKMKTKQPKFMMKLLYRYQKMLANSKKPIASGYCIFTNSQVFSKSGGFNEKIRFGEDYEYISKTAKYGFGFVESTYYYVNLRRFDTEGWRYNFKAAANELYRLGFGYKKLERNPVKYEFGKHQKHD